MMLISEESSMRWVQPIDGKGEIPADDYRPIEQEAPGIVDRQSVDAANGDRNPGNRFHVPNRTWTA